MSQKPRAMRDALLECIYHSMAKDDRIFIVTADFGSPVLDKVRADYPNRFVNVGIAEQNLINVSAGLALEGFKVFAYAIAPFITMRCFEQLRVSLGLLSTVRPMNVNLIGVGAGYSYVVSGPTHQCYEDISLIRALPSFQLFSSADHVTSAGFLDLCLKNSGPKYLRLDAQILPALAETIDVTKGLRVLRDGSSCALIATGYMVHTALAVADEMAQRGITCKVVDLFNLTGFDELALIRELQGCRAVTTLEEGFRARGGMDALIIDFVRRHKLNVELETVGVEGGYRFELGSRAELHAQVGIGQEPVKARLSQLLQRL